MWLCDGFRGLPRKNEPKIVLRDGTTSGADTAGDAGDGKSMQGMLVVVVVVVFVLRSSRSPAVGRTVKRENDQIIYFSFFFVFHFLVTTTLHFTPWQHSNFEI